MDLTHADLLRHHGLKDTLPRRAVIQAMTDSGSPVSVQDIHSLLQKKRQTIGVVTIYRVVEALMTAGLLHRHPSEGTLSLCTMPDVDGHHVLLHCTACGTVREVHDHALCKRENKIAKRLKFQPAQHISELTGLCSQCQ